ncbi:DUF4253 domain-containing protein [Sphingomonas sp. HITSZ_GF]|uniref:DUF4253 domain-containing protein n=1 Tax=Sphingomonas sp. HITSZ_GF TaxID=3037247 RepID=UPI00240E6442|nr:DUF4253 domain-containing protein [Sphingomonas sp. HITSZ_GF]MDG2534452.1 DUF4253 domain-containing protein [Sphingomonas sp. HITSZ_GF]
MMRRGVLGAMLGAVAVWFGRGAAARPAVSAAPIPYPLVTVPGSQALATWERLRREGKGWPVVIGDDEALAMIGENFADEAGQSPEAALAAAAKIILPGALEKHFAQEYGADAEVPEAGDWPATTEGLVSGLSVASDILTGKPFERVHILLLPTSDGSEAPAYLRWGGWNACPPAALHVAVLRSWKQRYGAELVGLSGDVIDLRVTKRPATRAEAMALAREQYFYCSDIVDQGTTSLPPLAAGLMDSDWWFFWWD